MCKFLIFHYLNNNMICNRNGHSLISYQYYRSQKYISKVYLILNHKELFIFADKLSRYFSYNVLELYFNIIHIHQFISCIFNPICIL